MRRTKEEVVNTYNALLNSALTILARKGFEKATLEEIAAKANLTRGALYWHFKDKKDLYKKVLEREHQEHVKRIANIKRNKSESFQELIDLSHGIILNFYRNKKFRELIELTWFKSFPESPDKTLKVKKQFIQDMIERFKDLFASAIKNKQIINTVSPEICAITLNSIIFGIYRSFFVLPELLEQEKIALDIINQYLKGLERKKNGAS